jgi:hypothetical protein
MGTVKESPDRFGEMNIATVRDFLEYKRAKLLYISKQQLNFFQSTSVKPNSPILDVLVCQLPPPLVMAIALNPAKTVESKVHQVLLP